MPAPTVSIMKHDWDCSPLIQNQRAVRPTEALQVIPVWLSEMRAGLKLQMTSSQPTLFERLQFS